jgi:predicted O-methyltransferase YrrM
MARLRWSSSTKGLWRTHLKPEFGRRPIRYLEIGVWEGASSYWLLLSLNVEWAVIVDPWGPHLGHDAEFMANVEASARERLRPWTNKATLHIYKRTSGDFWREHPGLTAGMFDLIHIDGDHSAPAVLEDVTNAWHWLRPGGIVIFDDYGGKWHHRPVPYVREAVDSFLACNPGAWEPFFENWKQKAVRKRQTQREFLFGWFNRWPRQTFDRYLPAEFERRPVRYLEIGVWEGASCCWVFDNLNVERAVAVDPWAPIGRRHPKWQMEQVARRARCNLAPWIAAGTLDLRRQSSRDYWESCGNVAGTTRESRGNFDLIYVDGDHTYEGCLNDSIHAWRMLEPGGILIWDDYHKRNLSFPHVPQAVDRFLEDHAGQWQEFYTTAQQKAVRKVVP